MARIAALLILVLFVCCSTDKVDGEDTLVSFLDGKELVLDNVIACAASNMNDKKMSVFFYPRTGASNIRYYETINALVNKNDFENYKAFNYPLVDLFNGYLKKFEIEGSAEKWVIITYDEGGKTHLSNPIHLKQNSKPTEYLPTNIMVNTLTDMPLFTWEDGIYDDTKIYFQVVSNAQDNLLSGTYTYEKTFRYYDLQNVVLNITKNTPPALKTNNRYRFTLMGVSEDNWVNQFSIVDFEIK